MHWQSQDVQMTRKRRGLPNNLRSPHRQQDHMSAPCTAALNIHVFKAGLLTDNNPYIDPFRLFKLDTLLLPSNGKYDNRV